MQRPPKCESIVVRGMRLIGSVRESNRIDCGRKRPNNYSDDHLVELFRSITLFQSGILIDTVNTELDQLLRQNNMTINDLEDRITPRCTDMFERCMWKGTQTRCDTLFQSIQTSYGLCCSFNYYGKSKSNYPT